MQPIKLSFLKGRDKGSGCVSWGIPWKQSEMQDVNSVCVKKDDGVRIPVQNSVRAFWPDGSVKWSFHSANINCTKSDYFASIEQPAADNSAAMCTHSGDIITVNTGKITVQLNTAGSNIIKEIQQGIRKTCCGARLVAMLESRSANTTETTSFLGHIQKAEIEENGPVRSVIKFSGTHIDPSTKAEVFPFTLRFYFFVGTNEIKIVHSFIYDADAQNSFLKGIGMQFDIALTGRSYNRHIKIAGDNGFMHEALQLLTSWRPRLDPQIYKRQLQGERIHFDYNSPTDEENLKAVADITTWDNYKIYQDSSEHFLIKKRTKSDTCAYIDAYHGRRAKGFAYMGGYENGMAVGMRDFWQKYPSSIDVNGASGELTTLTAWLWSPDSQAADMRHYDTEAHASAYYEGFDEIRSTPYGIANTNEIYLWGFDAFAQDEELAPLVETVCNPPVMVCGPEYYNSVKAFGVWSLPDYENAEHKWYEEQLDKCIDFYKREIEQRKWYGFFNYGDFMHTYDSDRHCWKYDMGGYAWQNTELVPTLWLWLAFMRSGREDIYTMAEAMTRHTSEVDVYHIGEYKGLGSRHNVVHWGCACKEARIAMAGHHRYYYYISGDERVGDVFDDVKDAEYAIERLDPLRFFYDDNQKTHARTGPDWSSLCSNWITAWERHNDTACRDKLLKGIEGIKKAPLKLASGSDFGFDPEDGSMIYIGESAAGGSHLAICMGAPSVWMEMADLINDPEFNDMMADYGEFYILSPEEKREKSGGLISGSGWSFPYMAASMIAYYANAKNDKQRAEQVWEILKQEWQNFGMKNCEIQNYVSEFAGTEAAGISTNFIAQWCLNVIMCLKLISE